MDIIKHIGTKNKRNNVLLFGILTMGFVLRVVGYDWGGASTFHPDEGKVVGWVINMARSGKLISQAWIYPNQATSKILALLLFFVNKARYIDDFTYYHIYRIFIAIFSTATIYFSFLIIKKIRGIKWALLFSLFVAINPIYVKYAKEVIGDNLVLFWWVVIVYLSLLYLESKRVKWVVLMSFFASCATMEKWNGACVCLYIALVIFLVNIKAWALFIKQGAISLSTYIVGIIAIAPNILVERESVRNGIDYAYIYKGGKQYPIITTYPKVFLTYIGILGTVLVILGMINVYQKWSKYCIAYSFGLVCLASQWLVMTRIAQERWGFGIFWGMIAMLMEGIHFIDSRKGKICRPLSIMVVPFISILMCLCFLSEMMVYEIIAMRSEQDTRILSEEICKNYEIDMDNSISDIYSTFIPGGTRKAGGAPFYKFEEIFKEVEGTPTISIAGKKYVILSSYYEEEKLGGYDIVKKYAPVVFEIGSPIDKSDLFIRDRGHGEWYYPDCDTIRNAIIEFWKIYDGANIGPRITVYDVSEFKLCEE